MRGPRAVGRIEVTGVDMARSSSRGTLKTFSIAVVCLEQEQGSATSNSCRMATAIAMAMAMVVATPVAIGTGGYCRRPRDCGLWGAADSVPSPQRLQDAAERLCGDAPDPGRLYIPNLGLVNPLPNPP